jgi:sugar/nucleoside kinase (ribokinase family)
MNNKRFEVIVVGELNVDLILNSIDSFPEIGKEKIAKYMTLTLGSSSAIFASNLSALGANVAFAGKIGDDAFGTLVKDSLQRKKVNTDFLITSNQLNTGVTIVLNYSEDRAMVTYPGAMEDLTVNDIKEEVIKSAKHLHFSSYFLQPGMRSGLLGLFKMAKENGLTTSLDIQWDPGEKWDFNYREVLPYVDVFMPNEQEALFLTQESVLESAINKLTSFGRLVIVKLGSKGSIAATGKKSVFKKSYYNNNVVDAIGAGDSFNAGFILKYIRGCDIDECQSFANLTGAINTTAAGGTSAFESYEQVVKVGREKFGFEK